MEYTLPRDDSAPAGIKSWQLWFSLGAGAIVWMIHLTIIYALTSLSCVWDWFPFTWGGLTGLQAVQLIITGIAIFIALLAVALAVIQRQRLQRVDSSTPERHDFMINLSLALNSLFLALLVTSIVPILTLPPC